MVKKILYIMSNEPVGGVGSVVKNYQSHFQKEKIKIDFIIFDPREDTPFNRTVKENGASVYTFPFLSLKNVVKITILLQKFYKEHEGEYEIVQIHSPNIAWMCFWNIRCYGVKFCIVHSHATLYSDKKLSALRNMILCIPIRRLANVYMACSKAAGQFLFGKKNIDKVIIVKNAIDCRRYGFDAQKRKDIRQKLALEDSFVVGNAGRFCEQKNHKFLLDIFEEIKKIKRDAVLMLIGNGPMFEEVKRKAKQKGLENDSLFLGTRTDVPDLLQAMDVFVLPSLFEGLPVIGIEAQASGIPCVVSDEVTKELDIFNIKHVSLEKTPKEWADVILNMKEVNRKLGLKKVIEAGYDIQIEALKLQNFYLNLK